MGSSNKQIDPLRGMYTSQRMVKDLFAAMKLKTELAIKAAIETQAPAAWSRKNFEALLKQYREAWGAPQSLTTSGLIEFLIDNEIVRPVEIRSKAYDRKMRYVLGRPSPLQFALSFFKDSYLSHASALEVHGLGSSEMTYVNREQSPKKTTSRLSQGRIDMAFESQPRRSSFEFVSGSFKVTFLNGKHTGDAGVIEMLGPSAERVRVTSLERTFIDCVVRPQYAGGIAKVAAAYRDASASRVHSRPGSSFEEDEICLPVPSSDRFPAANDWKSRGRSQASPVSGTSVQVLP